MNDYLDSGLDRVELRQLEAFRAIAEAGTFHGAATDTGFSQSVISQHLATLERNIGLRLVERGRGKRHIELTQAGEILLKHVEAIDATLGAASADLHQLRTGFAGVLRVGTFQSVSAKVLPALLSRFAKKFPDVRVEVRESVDDQDLLPLVAAGQLDFAFTAMPLAAGPFEAVEVLRDSWLLLTQVDSPLANLKTPLSVKSLKNTPFIGFGTTGIIQNRLEEYLRGHGMDPNIIFRTNDNVAVTELVATGFASALMPSLTIGQLDKRVIKVPVDIPSRSIALAWNSKRTRLPAAQSFIEHVQAVCDTIGKS